MSDEFVALATYLRPITHEPFVEPSPALDTGTDDSTRCAPREIDEAVTAARLFRAALADVLEVAVQKLLRTIARDVLARELQLERADIAGIVASALEREGSERGVSVRAHPTDLPALACSGLERIADEQLVPGDIVIELRSGTIDLSLNARLEAAIAAAAP
jgi:flagellar biosynthesis/type III secretory pathway protein FliH